MVHKYFEIQETDYNISTEIPNIIRINDVTDEEAEGLYALYKGKFKNPDAKVIEGDHKEDGTSKPCKIRKFDSEGKLKTEYE